MIEVVPHPRRASKLVSRWQAFKGPANTAKAPLWCWPMLAACLLLQASLSWLVPRTWQEDTSPGMAPSLRNLTLSSLGETALASYAVSLYVQTFDTQAGRNLGLRTLDQAALRSWLSLSLDIHPEGAYPLLLASRVYASASQANEARQMLDLVHQRFLEAPNSRWPWLAHAVHVARHELNDVALAKLYARSLASQITDEKVPSWVRQLEIFLLEANSETEAARRLLGALIASGQVKNDAELRFLAERMKQLPASEIAGGDERH